jgi:regulator of protease activity HflC (stomatin/prohibitin superfamily)
MSGVFSFIFLCFGFAGFVFFIILISNIKQINEYQRGLLFQYGKFKGMVNPGWKFIIPFIQNMTIIDIRTKTVDLSDQEAMTSENVSVRIGAVVFFKVLDAKKAVLEVENFHWAISQMAETTMRSVVGEIPLNELLSNRDAVSTKIEKIIKPKAEEWGLEIVGVELKDIVLPENMKRTMAKLAEAEREKNSVIMKAEGEMEAAENLGLAAEKLSKTPGALHLRTLSTLNDLSSDQSNTVVFAVPLEVLRAFESFATGKSDQGGDVLNSIAQKLTGQNQDSDKTEGSK